MEFGTAGEVAPFDFDGETLALIDRSKLGAAPIIRLVKLESNQRTEVTDMPGISNVSVIGLWGHDSLAYAVGNQLRLYNYRKQESRPTLKGHWAEIVALDTQELSTLASVDGYRE